MYMFDIYTSGIYIGRMTSNTPASAPSTATGPSIVTRESAAESIDELSAALPISVAITDLDGFGPFNETNGRSAGDEVLAKFDLALSRNLPSDVLLHRIGGDEWVIAFPATPLENCLVLLEELRAHFESTPLGTDEHPITMSAGVASRPPHAGTGDELLRAADEALSRSKRGGRNRVAIFVEDKMVMKSNYYSRATLDRLAALSKATNRTEASLLREAADKLLAEYAAEM